MISFTFTTMKLNHEFTRMNTKAEGGRLLRVHSCSFMVALGLACLVSIGSVYGAAPNITGSAARNIVDTASTKVFSNLDISSSTDITVTITFIATHGRLSPTNELFTRSGNTYTLASTNTVDAVAFLSGLTFFPTENRVPVGDSETTTFTVVADNGEKDTNSNFSVDSTSVNDVPAIGGIISTQIFDNMTAKPFLTVTVDDPDPGSRLDLTVTLLTTNGANVGSHGTMQLSGGFIQNNSSTFTLDNATPSQAQSALRGLVFDPRENFLPVGSNEVTVFKLLVVDNEPNSRATNSETTVSSESLNDPPTITGAITTTQSVTTSSSILPFTPVTIADVDVGDATDTNFTTLKQRLTVQVTLTGTNVVGELSSPTFVRVGNIYTTAPLLPTEANAAIQNAQYVAPLLPVAGTNLVGMTITVWDDHNGTNANTSTKVLVSTPYQTVSIRGTQGSRFVSDKETIVPFSGVTVQSLNGQPVVALISLNTSNKLRGELLNLGGFNLISSQPDTYAATNFSENLSTFMRQLTFKPTENRIPGGSSETNIFTVVLMDRADPGFPKTNLLDNSTTVITLPANDPPTISGITTTNVIITDSQTRQPFPTALISDIDQLGLQNVTVTVSIQDDPGKGTFLPLAGVSSAGAGAVQFSGTPTVVTARIRQLTFQPTVGRIPVGLSETVGFNVHVDDAFGGVADNGSTRITVVAVNGAPVIILPDPQPLSIVNTNPIRPFQLVQIQDADSNVLVKVSFNTSAGSLTNLGGFYQTNNSPLTYAMSGSASNITTNLQELVFVPVSNSVTFTISATDVASNQTVRMLAVVLRNQNKTFIVTNTLDYYPSLTNVPIAGSLRKALTDAGERDHIAFALGGLPDVPALIRLQAPLTLIKDVSIDGPGANLLALSGDTDGDGTNDVRIFEIEAQAVIKGLTLRDGFDEFSGGGIEVFTDGSLQLSYCAISNCIAGQWGGGIDVFEGRLSIDHCLICANATSSSSGEGGGGVSIYSTNACPITDTTFSGNVQGSASGLGGGAIYAENAHAAFELVLTITSCTFRNNVDQARRGSSLRTNVSKTSARLKNSIFNDGQGNNLEPDFTSIGGITSLGGNISDDSTRTTFWVGGATNDDIILKLPSDHRKHTNAIVGPLADNGGPTLSHLPVTNSVAIGAAVSNDEGADQRGIWRNDGAPDSGAIEAGTFKRMVLNEIHADAPAASQFLEFYVPHEAEVLSASGLKVYVDGTVRHAFTTASVAAGGGLVLRGSTSVAVPGVVAVEQPTNGLHLLAQGGTVELKNAAGQVLVSATYLGNFDPALPPYAGQSVNLSPDFNGFGYIPQSRVVGSSSTTNSPGQGVNGKTLGPGNAPPTAYPDFAITDEDTFLERIPVRDNDVDPDRFVDTLRVVEVTQSALGGLVSITNDPTIGASINFDPRSSLALQSLPVGGQTNVTFTYTILDYLYGTNENSRGILADEISNNIVRATATVTVTVTGVNDSPTPADDTVSTTEDAPLQFNFVPTLVANDRDPDTDDNTNTLNIAAIHSTSNYVSSLTATSALGASVTLEIRVNRNETNIRYDPRGSAILNALSQNEQTNDVFYYSIIDSHGAIGTAAVYVTVNGVNDGPTAVNDLVTTDEDTPLLISTGYLLLNDTDPDTDDNGTTALALQVQPLDTTTLRGAHVSLTSTGILYDPTVSMVLRSLARKEPIIDSFTYSVLDTNGATSQGQVDVKVIGVNDSPIAVGDAVTISEDQILTISAPGVMANDIEYDINNVAPDDFLRVLPVVNGTTTLGGKFTVNADGSLQYDPTHSAILSTLGPNQTNVDTFAYTIMDGSLTIANDDSFAVKGDSLNNILPVLENDTTLAKIGGSNRIDQVGTPDKGGTVSISPLHDSLIYTPQASSWGIETFTYTISDGKGGTDWATVSVKVDVTRLNGNLTANPDRFTVALGTSAVLDVLANDRIFPDTTAGLSILALSAADNGGSNSISPNADRVLYTPAATGVERFTYVITGGDTAVATGEVAITVVDRTNGLNINEDLFTVLRDSTANLLDVLANDNVLPGPGPALTITGISTNASGTVTTNSTGNRLRYVPQPGFVGEDLFSYEIADGVGGTGLATVRVRVIDGGFNANDDIFTVPRNATAVPLAVLVNDNLLPSVGEQLFITVIGTNANAPNHGGVAVVNSAQNAVVYTPAQDFVGTETFTYEISYGTLARAQGRVTVRMVDRRNELSPRDDFFSVARNSVGNQLAVVANDNILPGINTSLTIRQISNPTQGGTVSISGSGVNSAIIYKPRTGFIGRETFSYEIVDNQGGTGMAAVTVDVGGLFTAPDQFSVLTDSAANRLNVLANDNIMPELGAIYRIIAFDAPHGGVVSIEGSGPNNHLLYTPTPGVAGDDSFHYMVIDDTGTTKSEQVTVHVIQEGSDRSTATVSITVVGENDPPIISGTVRGQSVYQHLTVKPFAGVTITEIDDQHLQPLIVTVRVNYPTNGYLATLGGFVDSGGGIYRFGSVGSGVTAAAATTALRGLTFVPTTGNRVLPGSPETTGFIITIDDSYAPPVVDTNTTVIAYHSQLTQVQTASVPNNDNYGQPVANTRDTVAIGAPFDKNLGGQAVGAVYVFVWRRGTFNDWDLVKKVVAPDGVGGDQFGASVAIDVNTLVVGAPVSIVNGKSSGSAYVFSRNEGGSNNWGFVKKVVSSDAASGDLFGGAVTVSGNIFAVGAKFDDPSGVKSGSVYVFDAVPNTNIYSQIRKVIAPDGHNGAQFGTSISLNGDCLGVGAPFNNSLGSSSGAAYVFERNYDPTNPPVPLANNWGMRKKVLPLDGVNNDQFGSSVSIHGNIFAAGSAFANVVGISSGAAYTFERDAGGPGNWGQLKKLVPADGQAGDQFGGAVSINNGTVVVGARQNDQQGVNAGAAYVYRRDFNPAAPAVPSLNQWGLIEKFLPRVSATNSHFAFAVSICSNTVVVGSSFDGNNQVPDAAYIFRLKFDNGPLFATPIPDQDVTVSNSFSYTIPADLIVDADVDDSLAVSATLSDGSPLPPWLHFDPISWTFTGTPGGSDIGTIGVKVTAVDQDLVASSDVFQITVSPPYVPPPVLDVDCTEMPNLYEWAFATNPTTLVPAILVTSMDHVTGNVYLTYRHRFNDTKLAYSLIVSTDFVNWAPGDALVDLVRRVPLSDAFEDVVLVVRNPSPAAQFFRIQVSCRQ